MRRASKIDTFQPIAETLFLAHGCGFQSLASQGKGVADALVCWRRFPVFTTRIAIVEFKSGARAVKRKGKTADRQRDFAAVFPVWILSNEQNVIDCIAWLKEP